LTGIWLLNWYRFLSHYYFSAQLSRASLDSAFNHNQFYISGVCLIYFHVYILTCNIFNTINSKAVCYKCFPFFVIYIFFYFNVQPSVCYLLYTFDIHLYRDIKHNLKRNYRFVYSLFFFIKYSFLETCSKFVQMCVTVFCLYLFSLQ
jgi:hypothetical protein